MANKKKAKKAKPAHRFGGTIGIVGPGKDIGSTPSAKKLTPAGRAPSKDYSKRKM